MNPALEIRDAPDAQARMLGKIGLPEPVAQADIGELATKVAIVQGFPSLALTANQDCSCVIGACAADTHSDPPPACVQCSASMRQNNAPPNWLH